MIKLIIYPKIKCDDGWLSGNPIKLEFQSLSEAIWMVENRHGKFTYSITGNIE